MRLLSNVFNVFVFYFVSDFGSFQKVVISKLEDDDLFFDGFCSDGLVGVVFILDGTLFGFLKY
ncbi:hypothetical protein [Maize bushy stunt phytoplasma]|uniref:hypothetical protein n=1 Tax=Maize bushy stunt phytoplasma TaxID=202462 RepID=UPI00083D47A2|nr:hypothetical protein [Maize bushy stunt phytoplasma]